ncbi:MAG TPA: histidine kinase [Candidatus Acidoferrales bacterium]|nr:histidine kinase [Candidatus Acidoferrales bacterium]
MFLSFFAFLNPALIAHAGGPLTNAADVLALPIEQASLGVPVLVQGIVTYDETNWNGKFFMQDATGGIYVDSHTQPQPSPGDVLEVSGISHPGGYAPVITKPHWKKLGTAPLPVAKPITIDRLMSGAEDSQRVEISGIVRSVQLSGSRLWIELVSGGYRVRAFAPIPPDTNLQSLVGARVRLRGTAAAAANADLRHFVTVTLFVPQLADTIVDEAAPSDPFEDPIMPLNGIAQFRKDRSPDSQVHVKGVVTFQRKGEDIFLHDETGGLQVKTRLAGAVAPGAVVEAVGFPAVENYLPVLEDAVFRITSDPRVALQPTNAMVGELQNGKHHADLITLQGRLIDRLVRGAGPDTNNDNAGIQTILVLQTTNYIFAAEKNTTEENGFLTAIPIGSLVEVTGICLLESGDNGKIKSFRLLLPTSHDVRILEKPSWLTPQRLLISLAVVFGILLVAMIWTVMVSKKNLILKSLVREKETAQRELQEAHDQLEERVKERTAQLKVEMTARKESELQFRAVLTERTRLAQELHDTLEQTLTGIALQLDLVANQFEKKPDNASHHLKLARSLMRQSQVDLHRSVWGLRSRAEEHFNLSNALLTSGRQLTDDTAMRIEVETTGATDALSEIAEENLLRIGQEAITNAVKHSSAQTVKIRLELSPRNVILHIKDDGKGFVPETCAGPKDGHFGLLGIRERSERLGGQLWIASAPGEGTSIRVEIPLHAPNGRPAAPVANELS